MKFAAIFAIIVGIGMIGQWFMSYLSNSIPELKTEPIRIGFHLAAEMATALMLILSGIILLKGNAAGKTFFLIADGMLFYTCIVSPGYFAQQGKWAWTMMFGLLIAGGVVSATLMIASI